MCEKEKHSFSEFLNERIELEEIKFFVTPAIQRAYHVGAYSRAVKMSSWHSKVSKENTTFENWLSNQVINYRNLYRIFDMAFRFEQKLKLNIRNDSEVRRLAHEIPIASSAGYSNAKIAYAFVAGFDDYKKFCDKYPIEKKTKEKMMENRAKQSEILFIWDAKLCSPNGDMSSDNAPRFDEVDEKAIVSDVRVKRTIRDDLQYRKKEMIFINNEETLAKGLTAEQRFDQIKALFKEEKIDALSVFLKPIDNRLFGGVAPNSGIQLVGTVQFGWTKSLNKTETVLKSGTGAFATKGKDGEAKFKKTFRADNYIPYGIFPMYGTINRMQAEKAQTTENDILTMLDSLWMGTKFLNTRSKEGQKPRILIRVIYTEDSKYFIGLIDELVTLKNEDTSMLRKIEDAELDFSKLITVLNKATPEIEEVVIVIDASMEKYKSELGKIKNVKFVEELSIMQKEA